MNIVLVTGIFPPDIGGPATYMSELAQNLTSDGWEVRVVTLADVAQMGRETRNGYLLTRIPRGLARPLRIPTTIFTIARAARGWADLVYSNGLDYEAAVAARLSRRPHAVKIVGDIIWERRRNAGAIRSSVEDFQSEPLPIQLTLARWARNQVVRRASRVITPSRQLVSIVRSWGASPNSIELIYNGVQLPEQPSMREGFRGSGSEEHQAIMVGRLISLKRVNRLLEALAIAPRWSLTIVGDGPERRSLDRQAKTLDLQDRVRFVGALSRPETLRQIEHSDVVVLNSEHEGLPHVLLEARALGVPAVASDCLGNREVVVHGVTGLLVNGDRPAEIAAALARLEDPEVRMAMGSAGKENLERFKFHTMMQETRKVLLNTAGVPV